MFSTCWEVRSGKMWSVCQPSHDSHLSACRQPMQTRCGLSWFSPVKPNWITLQLRRAICVWAVTTEQLQMRACLHLSITVLRQQRQALCWVSSPVVCAALLSPRRCCYPWSRAHFYRSTAQQLPKSCLSCLTTLLYLVLSQRDWVKDRTWVHSEGGK